MGLEEYLDEEDKRDRYITGVARCLSDPKTTLAKLKSVLDDELLKDYLSKIHVSEVLGGKASGSSSGKSHTRATKAEIQDAKDAVLALLKEKGVPLTKQEILSGVAGGPSAAIVKRSWQTIIDKLVKESKIQHDGGGTKSRKYMLA